MKLLKCYTIKDLKSIPQKYLSLFNQLYKKMNLLQGFSWDFEKAFNLIKQNNYELKSIFLAVETLEPNLFGRKEYMNITRRKVPSLLKQKMAELSFHDRKFPFIVEEKCKDLKGEELDKCIDELLEKFYKKEAYERLKAEYQEIYPRSWKKKLKEIYKERWKFFYERKCEMKPLFNNFDWRNGWVQVFIVKHPQGFHWDVGGSASSGKRITHAYYGTLFCRIQKEIKDIPTIVLWYDSRNNFRYVATLRKFAICPREMWGKEKDMEGIRKIEFKEDYYTHKNSKIEVYL
jgi:hypothetical protein